MHADQVGAELVVDEVDGSEELLDVPVDRLGDPLALTLRRHETVVQRLMSQHPVATHDAGAYAGVMAEPKTSRLGSHRTGRSCLYPKRLADVCQPVLKDLVTRGFRHLGGLTVISEPQ
ncbi:hypothetical protein Ait01nite_055180 [Actinoplanes italicus]|nr:hypothetical protein Ait01nite_055180 [Actinoplanes italicus]